MNAKYVYDENSLIIQEKMGLLFWFRTVVAITAFAFGVYVFSVPLPVMWLLILCIVILVFFISNSLQLIFVPDLHVSKSGIRYKKFLYPKSKWLRKDACKHLIISTKDDSYLDTDHIRVPTRALILEALLKDNRQIDIAVFSIEGDCLYDDDLYREEVQKEFKKKLESFGYDVSIES